MGQGQGVMKAILIMQTFNEVHISIRPLFHFVHGARPFLNCFSSLSSPSISGGGKFDGKVQFFQCKFDTKKLQTATIF